MADETIELEDVIVWAEDLWISTLDPIIYTGSNGTIINYGNGMHIGRFDGDLSSGHLDVTSYVKVIPLSGPVDVVASVPKMPDSEEELHLEPSECWMLSPGLEFTMTFSGETDLLIQVLDSLE